MASQFFYDPSRIVVTGSGVPISGFQDGELISIVYEANLYDAYVGADGDTTRVRVLNQNAKSTLKLASSSRSNDVLSAIVNLGLTQSGASYIVALMFNDLQGTTLFYSAKAWVEKIPDTGFDKSVKAYEWPFYCTSVKHFVGGSIE